MDFASILKSVLGNIEPKKYTETDVETAYAKGVNDGYDKGIKDEFKNFFQHIENARKNGEIYEKRRILLTLQKALDKNSDIESWTVLVRNLINGGLK